jgi:hypothetical protein
MDKSDIFCVIVEHNLVVALRRVGEEVGEAQVPETSLEVATVLARRFQSGGSIDGVYYFHDHPRARVFASLCLDFVRKLAEKRLQSIEVLQAEEEYSPGAHSPASRPAPVE